MSPRPFIDSSMASTCSGYIYISLLDQPLEVLLDDNPYNKWLRNQTIHVLAKGTKTNYVVFLNGTVYEVIIQLNKVRIMHHKSHPPFKKKQQKHSKI